MNGVLFRVHHLLALCLIACCLSGCGGADAPETVRVPNHDVLLIVIDTCRADHIQAMGSTRVQTPAFDSIAEEGVLFTRAYTPVPMTLPAHASMFTGLHPVRHGVRDNFNAILPDEANTLAERFQQAGYATGAAVGAIVLGRHTGIQQGFDTYDDVFSEEAFASGQPILERIADEVTHAATRWLETRPNDKPFFYFAHYYDPHLLYRPPEPFSIRYDGFPYRGEIAYADHAIGNLLAWLRDNQQYDDTVVIITADHGEGLGDHKEQSHGMFLYQETTHVPLAIKLPRSVQAPRGRESSQIVSLIDIAPTLAELCGLDPQASDGVSLVPDLADPSRWEFRSLVLESQYPLTFRWSPLFALVDHEWKYIHAPRSELYNLPSDPGERTDRIASNSTQAMQMRQALEDRLLELARPAFAPAEDQPAADRSQMLASLGYVGGSGSTSSDLLANEQLPDPKDKIEIFLTLDAGLLQLSRKNIPKAIEMFNQVIRDDPENPTGYLNLGLAYANLNDWNRAIEWTERAIRISPGQIMMRLQLARFLVRGRQLNRAESMLNELLNTHPNLADVHAQLGHIALERGDSTTALHRYAKAREIMPNMPGLDESIARARAH